MKYEKHHRLRILKFKSGFCLVLMHGMKYGWLPSIGTWGFEGDPKGGKSIDWFSFSLGYFYS